MGTEPQRDPRILEAMEACRPGSDDVTDDAMTPLRAALSESSGLAQAYQRLQVVDRAMAEAMADVPVPEGLEGRILDRLNEQTQELGDAACVIPSEFPSISGERSGSRRIFARRWLVMAGSVAAAALLLVGVWIGMRPSAEYSVSEVLSFAIENAINSQHGAGALVTPQTPAPPEFPLSPALMSLVAGNHHSTWEVRWRPLSAFLNRQAVAYDLVGSRGISATLYVTECSAEGAASEIPLHSMHSSGQNSASAWREGKFLYILVVDGGPQTYEQMFAGAGGPLV